jgi:molecular chaperone GrpE
MSTERNVNEELNQDEEELSSPEQEQEDLTADVRAQRAEQEAEELRSRWMRAAADYQNLKRRSEQERQEAARFANASLIINILPVIDDLERALGSLDARLAGLTWVEGIFHIYRKFKQTLESAGVTEIQSHGADFDPNVHEAIQYSEGEEGKVVAEVQKGYKLGDRVIRPAMVVVGRDSGATEPGQGNQEQGQDDPGSTEAKAGNP